MNNFIKIIDNVGDHYYVNPTAIAYLKSTSPTPYAHYPNKQAKVNKIVLKNDKHIVVPSQSDFRMLTETLYGE